MSGGLEPYTADDTRFMALALAAGRHGVGRTAPNPAVGCALVRDGQLLATGFHRAAGQPHAEVEALAALAAQGGSAHGATAYVTLEPCNHQGRTGPCSEALLSAGVARVVAGMVDPNPRVAGTGLARLLHAGVQVSVGALEAECRELAQPFLTWIAQGRPWVRVKLAASLDGRIATASGESRWITGEAARDEVLALRDLHDAVLVGGETLRQDNPALTARRPAIEGRPARDPARVVVTRGRALPLDAQLFTAPLRARTLVLSGAGLPTRDRDALIARGVELRCFHTPDVPLDEALRWLGTQGLTSLLVEGGGALTAGLFRAGLVDAVRWYAAPLLLGDDGRAAVGALGLGALEAAPRLQITAARTVGDDVCIDASVRKGG